jgi:lipopolysaccharide export system protein LptA
MMRYRFSRFIAGIGLLILSGFIWDTVHAVAAGDNGESAGKTQVPIHIVSDRLTSDSEAKTAEFEGNVRATQGETIITSDRLKIFYSKGSEFGTTLSAGSDTIERIIASGNVKIEFENKVAYTHEAVYDTKDMTLTLSGDDSRVISGVNFISGAKIVLNRSDGRIRVESSAGKRVEALFNTEQNPEQGGPKQPN